jgi:hypothetical protein
MICLPVEIFRSGYDRLLDYTLETGQKFDLQRQVKKI